MNEILDRMESKWDQGAPNYDKSHVDNEDDMLWMEVLSKTLGADRDKRLLDVGTGTWFIVLKAARLGYNCTGLDMSEGMMSEAKEHGSEFAGSSLDCVLRKTAIKIAKNEIQASGD
jgi:ubiquinone/menaquinone biosynthesis C-methylase UbiE